MNNELLNKAQSLPRRPGVYQFKNEKGKVLYVGKALSLKDRVTSYFASFADHKQQRLVEDSTLIDTIETASDFEALLLEANLIKLHRPKYNVSLRDDKSYLYIFVSTGEEFPVVVTCRQSDITMQGKFVVFDGLKGQVFGPYPSASTVRTVLKQLRRIFPHCQQKRIGKRACFYSHIGLCRPCPSDISKKEGTEQTELKKIYRRNVLSIKRILEGKLVGVEKELEKTMNRCAKQQRYEQAAQTRNQLDRLRFLQQSNDITPYLEDAAFYASSQMSATEELKTVLAPYFVHLPDLRRIECFDISHLGTTGPVGSQVVFVNGIPEKGEYKRYHIKTAIAPNDAACMREMLTRRLNHQEWDTPNLIVIDGGKPQLSIVLQLMEKMNKTVPAIGLAKRNEQLVIKTPNQFMMVSLKRSSPALKLVQQLRDEAHRFANTFQRKTRALPKS